MKLLTPTEIKQSSESERTKDIARTTSVKSTLAKAQAELDEVNAKFELALANQQIRWAKEEEEAIKTIASLNEELKTLYKQREVLLIPIDEDRNKAHTLFKEAEKVLEEAKGKDREVNLLKTHWEDMSDLLTSRLDELSDREENLNEREQHIVIREDAIKAEREQIRQLSSELSNKLNKL